MTQPFNHQPDKDPHNITHFAEDRRFAPRTPLELAATLVDASAKRIIAAEANNISEGGLYLTAKQAGDLMVGQRVEVQFPKTQDNPSWQWLSNEVLYATVIRTERQSEDGTHLGVSLRFDQPLYM